MPNDDEIVEWVNYEYDCEMRGSKPMPKRDWIVLRRGTQTKYR